jgi:hypothetical protein
LSFHADSPLNPTIQNPFGTKCLAPGLRFASDDPLIVFGRWRQVGRKL